MESAKFASLSAVNVPSPLTTLCHIMPPREDQQAQQYGLSSLKTPRLSGVFQIGLSRQAGVAAKQRENISNCPPLRYAR